MKRDTQKTKVIFRKFKEGDIIALFPELKHYPDGSVESYQHIGQHGAADMGIISITKPVKPEDYQELKRELEFIGYNLDVRKRNIRR